MSLDPDARKRRLHFRAWHRGTKEADLMIGGFVDRLLPTITPAQMDWMERFLEETDVDIMSWITGTAPCPAAFEGEMMQAMRTLDYIPLSR
jgi:antitoxin CptB